LEQFAYNQRLGIRELHLTKEWRTYSLEEQQEILMHWEQVRGSIPERIKVFETVINQKQNLLYEEENFNISCILNSEIAELASAINDLWLLYRMDQSVEKKAHQ